MKKLLSLFKRNPVKMSTIFVVFGTIVSLISGQNFMDALCYSILTLQIVFIFVCIIMYSYYRALEVECELQYSKNGSIKEEVK